jgi:hypothetical protein
MQLQCDSNTACKIVSAKPDRAFCVLRMGGQMCGELRRSYDASYTLDFAYIERDLLYPALAALREKRDGLSICARA